MGNFKRPSSFAGKRTGGFQKRSGGPRAGGPGRGGFGGARKRFGSSDGASAIHSAVCSQCGEPCKVPFKPIEGKSVYCNNCFKRDDRSDSRPGTRSPRSEGRYPSRDDRPSRAPRSEYTPRDSRESRDSRPSRESYSAKPEVSAKQFAELNEKLDAILQILKDLELE